MYYIFTCERKLIMTDAVSGVKPSVASVEAKKPNEPTAAPAEDAKVEVATSPIAAETTPPETSGNIGAGVGAGTPTDAQAKKLYMTA